MPSQDRGRNTDLLSRKAVSVACAFLSAKAFSFDPNARIEALPAVTDCLSQVRDGRLGKTPPPNSRIVTVSASPRVASGAANFTKLGYAPGETNPRVFPKRASPTFYRW